MASTESERLLVQQVRRGDRTAWQQLIDRYQGRLVAFVDCRIHDRAASEDAVQETFIGFLTSLPHYDENRDLEAFLFAIAAHKLTDHLRRQGRSPIAQFGSDDEGRPLDDMPGRFRPASSIARGDERRLAEESFLTEALKVLTSEWMARGEYERVRCLELLLVKNWANKEVAQSLGMTEQAVASYKFQMMARIKEMARMAGLRLDEDSL